MKKHKEKKKPKGFQPGSRKGSKNAYLSGRIKEAKEKGFAWLTYKDKRIKIVPFFDDYGEPPVPFPEEHLVTDPQWNCYDPCAKIKGPAIHRPEFGYGYPWAKALVRNKNEGIALDTIWCHEDRLKSVKRQYLNDEEVLAVVVEEHPRQNEQT